MNGERSRRLARLVSLRSRAVDTAHARAAAAARETLDAQEQAAAARARWEQAASRAAPEASLVAVDELVSADAFVRTLSALDSRATIEHARRIAVQNERRRELTDARSEHRKLELWQERLVETERGIDDARERALTDDVAARLTRSRA